MEYFSEEYFRRYSLNHLNEQRTFSSRITDANSYFDIFLSYNIKDVDVVKGIFTKLSQMGYKVYLDIIVDLGLKTKKTDKETAQIIHNRLLHSNSLIYAQSANANQSNWMPWELGVVDGRNKKCMVMPVSNYANSIPTKREYLYLYPYLMKDSFGAIRIDSDDWILSGKLIEDYL